MLKRFIACILALLCLCIALSACGNDSEEQAPDVSMQDPSNQDQSVNEESSHTSNEGLENSSQESSDASAEESLQPDESLPPDISIPESTADEAPGFNGSFAGELALNTAERDGKAFRIAYTKVSPTSAKKCVTNPYVTVTAIYDGSTTRFFDAVSGEYYTILVGDYTLLSNNGFASAKGKGICFTRGDNGLPVWEETEDISLLKEYIIYWSQTYKTAYTVAADKNGNVDFYCFTQDSFVPCISNGKYGIVNNGVVTTPFEYDYIQSHQEGSVGVYLAVKDGKIYYINSNGTVLTPEGFTCGSAPCGNRAWVFQGDKGFVLEFN